MRHKVDVVWRSVEYTTYLLRVKKGLHLVLSTGCSPFFIVLRLGRWLDLL